ncbi:hypothetical protein ES705_47486 [subsurface metagenome]
MVAYQVKHQPEISAHPLHVTPVAPLRIHLAVINNGKTVIRGIGGKGQNMETRDNTLKMAGKKITKRIKGRFTLFTELITIGDQNGILLIN